MFCHICHKFESFSNVLLVLDLGLEFHGWRIYARLMLVVLWIFSDKAHREVLAGRHFWGRVFFLFAWVRLSLEFGRFKSNLRQKWAKKLDWSCWLGLSKNKTYFQSKFSSKFNHKKALFWPNFMPNFEPYLDLILAQFWHNFWSNFSPILIQFLTNYGPIFVPLWPQFWSNLGPN